MNKAQQHRSEYFYVQHLIHLTLQGKRPATIDAYTRALRRITHQLDKSPDTLTTDDLKRYFTQLIKTHSWSTVKIDRNGLQFFFSMCFSVIGDEYCSMCYRKDFVGYVIIVCCVTMRKNSFKRSHLCSC